MEFGSRMQTLIIILFVWETATDLNFFALSQGFFFFFDKNGVCLDFYYV